MQLLQSMPCAAPRSSRSAHDAGLRDAAGRLLAGLTWRLGIGGLALWEGFQDARTKGRPRSAFVLGTFEHAVPLSTEQALLSTLKCCSSLEIVTQTR